MDQRGLGGTPWVQAEYPDNTTRFFPQETRNLAGPQQAQAFYDYQAQRPNPMVDAFVQDLQGASGRGLAAPQHQTPRAFPQLPVGRGMALPTTPRARAPTTPPVVPLAEGYGRWPGSASNMGSTDMLANPMAYQHRTQGDLIGDMIRGAPPAPTGDGPQYFQGAPAARPVSTTGLGGRQEPLWWQALGLGALPQHQGSTGPAGGFVNPTTPSPHPFKQGVTPR